jgi:hypothetical protein
MAKLLNEIIIILIIFLTLHIVFLKLDYMQIASSSNPTFSFKYVALNNGSSIEYIGLGYKIISHNTAAQKEFNGQIVDGFMKGPEAVGPPFLNILDQIIAPKDLQYVPGKEDMNKSKI